MKRIGTTEQGEAILVAGEAELLAVDQAIVTLMNFREHAGRPPELKESEAIARALNEGLTKKSEALRPAKKPEAPKVVKAVKTAQAGKKECSICHQFKAAGDFYAIGRQCKVCLRERGRQRYAQEQGGKAAAPLKASAPVTQKPKSRLELIREADERVKRQLEQEAVDLGESGEG